jgi:outer membrane protein assembly factor BamB
VVALDAGSGAVAWEFTAGARIDSPPTVRGDRALFGCRDGYVYCVRLADGVLAWRLRVARAERHVAVDSQFESAWPAFGSVLLRGDAAYVTAGRSSYLDGGIDLCRIDPDTGRLLARSAIYTPDPDTGTAPPQYGPSWQPGARADVLSADVQYVYLRDQVFEANGKSVEKGNPHLFTVTGFLDDAWTHRSYWIFGHQNSMATGCSGRAKDLVYARLLVFDTARIYGYGRKTVHWSNQLEDGPYHLFALSRADNTRPWSQTVPVKVRALVLAGDTLFAAGAPGEELLPAANAVTPTGGVLLALSATDGAEQARCDLDAPPAFDGLAAAYGKLYLTTADGKIVCLAGK